MAYDEGVAEVIRGDLADLDNVVEKKMMGGLCFMWQGNMLCGVHKGGGMFRVGKENHDAAMRIKGARVMDMTGRVMKGFVDVDDGLMADDVRRARVLGIAKEFVGTLPPK